MEIWLEARRRNIYGAMRINGKLNVSYLTYLDEMESEALNLRVLLLDEARRFRFA